MGVLSLLLAVVPLLLSLVHAQNGATGANNETTPTSTEGDITIHYVTVGLIKDTFQVSEVRCNKLHFTHTSYQPNSIVAAVGDIVSFQFYPSNHSVIRSAYGYPCIPIEDVPSDTPTPFFSGFFPVSNGLPDVSCTIT